MQLRELDYGDVFVACHEKEGELFVKLNPEALLRRHEQETWDEDGCCVVKIGVGTIGALPASIDVEPMDITFSPTDGDDETNQLTQLTHTLEKLAPQDHTLERLLVGVHKAMVMIFLDGRDNHVMAAKKLLEDLEPLATVINKRYDDSGG